MRTSLAVLVSSLVIGLAAAAPATAGDICGIVEPARPGDLSLHFPTGYLGADWSCRAACGKADSAHICTAEELRAAAELDGNLNRLLREAGPYWHATTRPTGFAEQTADCRGFRDGGADVQGAVWLRGASEQRACSTLAMVACCL